MPWHRFTRCGLGAVLLRSAQRCTTQLSISHLGTPAGVILGVGLLSGQVLCATASATIAPVGRVQPQAEDELRHAPVGEPRWIRELVIPGPEVAASPGDFRTPIVLRIDSVSPHGTDLRYDLTWYGLDPGVFDLRDYLRRVDGSDLEGVPPILVEVQSVLPAGLVKPHDLGLTEVPLRATYRPFLWGAAAAWVIGLVLLLRKRRQSKLAETPPPAPRTLADALRPLVQRALTGQLSQREQADLELTLIAYWRRKLGWEGVGAAEALVRLRQHPEAGGLLVSLEEWLHRPSPQPQVDLEALLAPYRDPIPSQGHTPSQLAPSGSASGSSAFGPSVSGETRPVTGD